MINALLLIVGFVVLIYGANLLVDSASALAKKLNVPNLVIGLTIVAFGTSSPELSVNVIAALNENSAISLGNVIGSNILNILVILGLSSVLYPIRVKSSTTWIEIPLCFLSALLVLVTANDILIDGSEGSVISRTDGIIFIFFFIIFLVYNFQLIKNNTSEEVLETKNYTISKSIIFMIAGLALLVVGGKLIVDSATNIARLIGLSERIIALTIVSFGTSLPELATSLISAKKKNVDLAIGNIVGSNIFNVFFILGISAIIYPVEIQPNDQIDLLTNVITSLLLFAIIFIGKGRKIQRGEGILFLVLYLLYITGIIIYS